MIYGSFGAKVQILRMAAPWDIERLEGRKPDAQDLQAIERGSYVVVEENGKEELYSLAYLRADEGLSEIERAIDAARHPLVVVATDESREAHRISRYLNVRGVPTALHPAGVRRLDVRINASQERRAREILSERPAGAWK